MVAPSADAARPTIPPLSFVSDTRSSGIAPNAFIRLMVLVVLGPAAPALPVATTELIQYSPGPTTVSCVGACSPDESSAVAPHVAGTLSIVPWPWSAKYSVPPAIARLRA